MNYKFIELFLDGTISGLSDQLSENPNRISFELTNEDREFLRKNNITTLAWDIENKCFKINQDKLKEELLFKVLNYRNKLLTQSDWTVLADVPLSKSQKDAWKTYRQALRDITKQEGFPENVVFPEKPV